MADPIELTWAAAAQRFGLAQELQAWNEDDPVQVWEGAVTLEYLDLDGNVVVDGDLTITGDLDSQDESGFLVVLGNLTVDNVLSGGGQITVRGDLTARNGVHADYNHGYLWVKGNLTARIVLAEHAVRVDGTIAARTVDFGGFARDFAADISRQRAVYESKDLFASELLNDQGYVDGPSLADRLRARLPILADGSA